MAKINEEEFKIKLNKDNPNLELISTFKSMNDRVLIRCKICEHMWEPKATNLVNSKKRGCPQCANKIRKNNLKEYHSKEFYLENLVLNEPYEWLDSYSGNNKEKHKIRHLDCGNIYEIRPNDFQQGYRCPSCSRIENLLVKKIESYLISNKINFEREYPLFGRYKIDFKIDNLFVEIDGEQHFRKSNWNYNVRFRDKQKNSYIIKNKMTLIRIPYHSRKEIPYLLQKFSLIIENMKEITEICKVNSFYFIGDGKEYENEYYEINDHKYLND
jgi:very-short-patch-repair endonuclease